MAQNPYNPVADVSPETRAPDDSQHIEANPSSFGGTIATGLEKFGAGATDMSKFWGHVQADDASNNAQKEASDLAEHIRSLQGQDALDAQEGAHKSLDGIYAKYRNQLSTPDQQHIFDGQNRPFFDRYIRGQLNTTFIDAGRTVAANTAKSAIEVGTGMAATAGSDSDWTNVEIARRKIYDAEYKLLVQQGKAANPDEVTAAQDRATAAAYKSGIEGMLQKNPDGAWAKLQDPDIKRKLGAAYEPIAKTVELGVAQSYVSKADAMEVDNPAKAEQFVRDNEMKFGKAYGAALDKASKASKEATIHAVVADADAKVAGGYKPPPHGPVAASAMHMGDSIATGTAAAQYGEGWRSNPDVTAEVGKRPDGVLGQIKTVAAKGPDAFAGRDVVLSTGTSNVRRNGSWSRDEFDTAGVKTIGEQLDTLKAAGADMSRVHVLGVGPKAGGDYANGRLKVIAAQHGAAFSSVPAGDYGPDGIHLTPAGYAKLNGGGAAGAGAPDLANFNSANSAMKLTPQEQALYKRHLTNLSGPGGVDNADGSRSTLFQTSVEHDGKTYNIPTVWDGKLLKTDDAVARVRAEGWDKFPSYPDEATAEARYQQMHGFMEKDTAAYLHGKATPAAGGGATASPGATATDDQLYNAFHGQESGGGRNITTSIDDAHGDMQIIPDTFKRFAKPGERIDNRADNIAVGKRILSYYREKYNGDAARVAVAYFSGEGNVAPPGSPTPWKSNRRDGQGTFVSQYVNGILTRLGHPGVSGGPHPVSSTSYAGQPTAMRGWEGATPSAPASDAPPTEPAAFTPPTMPPTPPQSPEEIKSAIYDDTAAKIRLVNADDRLDAEGKIKASAELQQQQAVLLAGLAEKDAAIKAREEAGVDDVLGVQRKEGPTAAFRRLDELMKDPKRPISEKLYNTLSKSIEQDTNNPNPRSMGSGWTDALTRLQLPASDPRHIGEYAQILELKTSGVLTKRGADDIFTSMVNLRKEEDEQGLLTMKTANLHALEKIMTAGGYDAITGKAGDSYGAKIYETTGIEAYNTQYNAWRRAVREGKADATSFPLSDPKKLTAFANSIYPPGERAYLRLQDEHPELPAIPANVDPKGWGEVYGLAKENPEKVGEALARLASDPQTQIPLWNSHNLGRMISAEDALKKMGVPFTPAPARPHSTAAMPAASDAAPAESGGAAYGAITSDPKAAEDLQHILQIGPSNPDWHLMNPALQRDALSIKKMFADWYKDFEQFKRTRSKGPAPYPPIYAPPPRESE